MGMLYKRLLLVLPVLHVYSFNFKESKWFIQGLHGMLLRKATSLLQPSSCTGSNRPSACRHERSCGFNDLSHWQSQDITEKNRNWQFFQNLLVYVEFIVDFPGGLFPFPYRLLLDVAAAKCIELRERFHGIKTCESGLGISKYRKQLQGIIQGIIHEAKRYVDILISKRVSKSWDFGLAALDCDWREHWMAALGYWRGTLENSGLWNHEQSHNLCRHCMPFFDVLNEDVQQLFAFFTILISMFFQYTTIAVIVKTRRSAGGAVDGVYPPSDWSETNSRLWGVGNPWNS